MSCFYRFTTSAFICFAERPNHQVNVLMEEKSIPFAQERQSYRAEPLALCKSLLLVSEIYDQVMTACVLLEQSEALSYEPEACKTLWLFSKTVLLENLHFYHKKIF